MDLASAPSIHVPYSPALQSLANPHRNQYIPQDDIDAGCEGVEMEQVAKETPTPSDVGGNSLI